MTSTGPFRLQFTTSPKNIIVATYGKDNDRYVEGRHGPGTRPPIGRIAVGTFVPLEKQPVVRRTSGPKDWPLIELGLCKSRNSFHT